MEWSENYATGSKAIDDDHKYLIKLINHYYSSVHRGDPQASLDAILELLDKYILEHFGREEQLMYEIDYPGIAQHQKAHRKLIKAYRATKTSFHISPDTFDADGFLDFLQTWLTQHILIEDMKYVPYIERERLARKREFSSGD